MPDTMPEPRCTVWYAWNAVSAVSPGEFIAHANGLLTVKLAFARLAPPNARISSLYWLTVLELVELHVVPPPHDVPPAVVLSTQELAATPDHSDAIMCMWVKSTLVNDMLVIAGEPQVA
jgi:hypothetical protein